MSEEKLVSAHFHPKLGVYWLVSGAIIITITVVGIPLLLLWFPVGLLAVRRYIANMSAELTEKRLIVRKGLLTRTENTVPLDKITDMALIQGPLMRLFGIYKLTVETAGQSGTGSLINLVGVVDVQAFREQVLLQKSLLTDRQSTVVDNVDIDQLLLENLQQMNATLQRIEQALTPHSPQ